MKTYLQGIKEQVRESGFKKEANNISLHHTGKIAFVDKEDVRLFEWPRELIEFLKQRK